MRPSILILTSVGDTHAYAVAEALLRRGADVALWHTSDFPSRSRESIVVKDGVTSINVEGPGLLLSKGDRFDTIWNRRPSYSLDLDQLHQADRDFAWSECAIFRQSLFSLFSPSSFWVNRPECSKRCTNKPIQHQVAADLGFLTPETLYSNDPAAIRAFIGSRTQPVIYKPYSPAAWKTSETEHVIFTSIVTLKDVESDPLLGLVPGIYQELVPKAYELRLVACGDHVFGAKVLSQQTQQGKVDWRKAYSELRFDQFRVPQLLAERCKALINALGLVFGCLDLIVRPDGEVVFLEINEMGQFLFLERYSGIPALDIFCEFLLCGDASFRYKNSTPRIQYEEILGSVADKYQQRRATHAPLQERAVTELC